MNDAEAIDDPEVVAIGRLLTCLEKLDRPARQRVLDYVTDRLELTASQKPLIQRSPVPTPEYRSTSDAIEDPGEELEQDELDGVSSIAKKWMRRNDLSAAMVSQVYSLGIDEIDLVASDIPGKSKRERTRNIFLLKGIAEYLSSGVARCAYEAVKEACLHYDAFDSPNHAKYVRGLSSEVSGSKDAGYQLTARGITSATALIKEMVGTA